MAAAPHAIPLTRGGALDALRVTAAGFIMLYHFGLEEAPRALAEFSPVLGRGYLGTNLFLLLSGYILARAYGDRIAAGAVRPASFFFARLLRIWPAHLVVLIGFAAVAVAASVSGVSFNNPEAFGWESWLRQALLIHAWGFGPEPGWNSATWTLSALAVCYGLFPLLWRALSRLSPLSALAVGLGGLVAAEVLAQGAGAELRSLPPAYGLGRALPLFLLGAAVARAGAGLQPRRAAALGLAGMAALAMSQLQPAWPLLDLVAASAVVAAAGAHAPKRPSRLVRHAASASFALFMTHNLIGLVWFKAVGLLPWALPEGVRWGLWAAVFPICMVGAWIFHRWIDTPLQAWLKSRPLSSSTASRSRAPTAAPA